MVRISDPQGIFADVRLGDPAHGMLKYDTTLWPNFFFSGDDFYGFTNEPWQDTARLTIENPRTGIDFSFQSVTSDGDGHAVVFVDYANEQASSSELQHVVIASQSVIAPEGYQGPDPIVSVELSGPLGTLNDPPENFWDARLPEELNLDDWPTAVVSFYDLTLGDQSETTLDAVIHTMTAKITGGPVGDYDYDGDVDARDYVIWRIEYGDTSLLYADGNGDGTVNLADNVVWRDNLGSVSPLLEPFIQTVPEPAGGVLLVAIVAAWGPSRRIHKCPIKGIVVEPRADCALLSS